MPPSALKTTLRKRLATLASFPSIGRTGRVDGTRELVAFSNYVVVYQGAPDAIRILRVLHAAQQWPPDDGP